MQKIILMTCIFLTALFANALEVKPKLPLSNKIVHITDGESRAVFQLYDTQGAKELYTQLPLKLKTTNFRDAQWMFYPPKKLHVKQSEAYHDGKFGELSYYEPWGDVFILYKDFYAGDKMHRLGICIEGINSLEKMSGMITLTKATQKGHKMKIAINDQIIYELNDSQASKELYNQLPLEIEVENYSHDEKIFYPPNKLGTSNTPTANAKNGTLAYYAPWGDVVMFYKDFGSAGGLYELGEVVSGKEHIKELSGTVKITTTN